MSKATKGWAIAPVVESLDVRTVWEHTPLDYYRYGEYPRFIRPVGAHRPRTKLIRVTITEDKTHD